jgi:uncharacterized membrane protein (GlpM family)
MYFCQVFVSLNHVYQIGYNAKMKFLTLFALVTLMPSFVYAQTASLETLLKGIVGFTNNTLIPFLVGIAFLFFVINVFRYFILNGENEKGQENAKNLAMYSVAAFVFLLIFWGIVNMLSTSSGLEGCNRGTFDYVDRHFTGPSQPACP